MTIRSIVTPLLLFLAGVAVMWTFLTFRYARAEDVPAVGPAYVDAMDAGVLVKAEPAPPPDVAADPGGFFAWARDGFSHARRTGALFSWGILVAFAVLAAVWQRLKPKGDDKPSTLVAVLACAVGVVALLADVLVGAGHFALVATSVGPVVVAIFVSPLVKRGAKAVQS